MQPRTTYRVIYIVHKRGIILMVMCCSLCNLKKKQAGRHRKRGMQKRKMKAGDRRKMIRQVPEGRQTMIEKEIIKIRITKHQSMTIQAEELIRAKLF